MSGLALDCSVAVSWCFEDEATPEMDALLDQVRDLGAIVPGIWHLELGNVLLQVARRERISSGDMATRLALISVLPITTDSETAARALREVLTLAQAEGLTTYDAAYLELAMRRSLPLASKDSALREAAGRVVVSVLPA